MSMISEKSSFEKSTILDLSAGADIFSFCSSLANRFGHEVLFFS